MTFTDDDLKRTKKELLEGIESGYGFNGIYSFSLSDLEALLARLEAVLEPHEDGCGVSVNMDCTCDMPARWEAWLKAAGK